MKKLEFVDFVTEIKNILNQDYEIKKVIYADRKNAIEINLDLENVEIENKIFLGGNGLVIKPVAATPIRINESVIEEIQKEIESERDFYSAKLSNGHSLTFLFYK